MVYASTYYEWPRVETRDSFSSDRRRQYVLETG